MKLPFSESAFLDLFGLYNRALWPLVAVALLVLDMGAPRLLSARLHAGTDRD